MGAYDRSTRISRTGMEGARSTRRQEMLSHFKQVRHKWSSHRPQWFAGTEQNFTDASALLIENISFHYITDVPWDVKIYFDRLLTQADGCCVTHSLKLPFRCSWTIFALDIHAVFPRTTKYTHVILEIIYFLQCFELGPDDPEGSVHTLVTTTSNVAKITLYTCKKIPMSLIFDCLHLLIKIFSRFIWCCSKCLHIFLKTTCFRPKACGCSRPRTFRKLDAW